MDYENWEEVFSTVSNIFESVEANTMGSLLISLFV